MVAASKKQKTTPAGNKERLNSLDQFRGYTVVGMLLVNYFGGYAACPQILKHSNDYCSYADTIMPQFLFAVGFALRLTFGRRVQSGSSDVSYWRIVRRLLGLVLISMVVYNAGAAAAKWDDFRALTMWQILGEPLKRTWFQTLMHIAVTSLWILLLSIGLLQRGLCGQSVQARSMSGCRMRSTLLGPTRHPTPSMADRSDS